MTTPEQRVNELMAELTSLVGHPRKFFIGIEKISNEPTFVEWRMSGIVWPPGKLHKRGAKPFSAENVWCVVVGAGSIAFSTLLEAVDYARGRCK